jgi:hypothetical protein
MIHRYGRHGTRAWLRWRQRHYIRPSLVPVPVVPTVPVVVIQVQAPINVERIIVIVTRSTDTFDDENTEQQGMVVREQLDLSQNIPSSLLHTYNIPKTPSSDNDLDGAAMIKAISDVREIKKLIRDGKSVCVNQARLEEGVEDIVYTYLKENRSKVGFPPDKLERRRLIDVCNSAYQKYFQEEIGDDQESLKYLATPEETRLREIAMRDKEGAPPRHERDYHIRDLAVIRVLQLRSIPLDCARDQISVIHTLSDRYQEYYSNPREEVTWPDQETF